MHTRNGEEIEIIVECEGRRKVLGEHEMGVIIDTKANFGRLVIASAAKLDVRSLALLASAAAKSLMKKDYLAEKKALFEASMGFRANRSKAKCASPIPTASCGALRLGEINQS